MDLLLDEFVGFKSSQTNNLMIRLLFIVLKPYDITPEQWTVLKRVSEHDGLNQTTLGEVSSKNHPTLTRILKILERKKLIERKEHPEDRRSSLIHATENGRQLVKEIRPRLEEVFSQMISGISDEDLDIYMKVINQIQNNVKTILKEG